jgi:hypothetical protein
MTPIDVAELTKEWDKVMPDDKEELYFSYDGIYDKEAVLEI